MGCRKVMCGDIGKLTVHPAKALRVALEIFPSKTAIVGLVMVFKLLENSLAALNAVLNPSDEGGPCVLTEDRRCMSLILITTAAKVALF